MNKRTLLATLLAFSAVISCKRDPIYEEISKYRLNFVINDSVLYNPPRMATRIQFNLYDSNSGKRVYETFVPLTGDYLYDIKPGVYDVAAWTMNTERTHLNLDNDFNVLNADTAPSQTSPVRVIAMPDHVFANVTHGVTVPTLTEQDPEFVLTLDMATFLDSWKIEVDGIKGLEYAAKSSFLIYNQAYSTYLKDWSKIRSGVISASGSVNLKQDIIECPFNTFGMPEKENEKVYVVTTVTDDMGAEFRQQDDVTGQVNDLTNTKHIIRIHMEAELHPSTEGGLDPNAKKWDSHYKHIDIL